ncbi:MAG: DUF308 domain-containing protein [Caldilineaceae bacterium]|nr:DUF308 domain-containing protein [Caldilineaceae bacterium]
MAQESKNEEQALGLWWMMAVRGVLLLVLALMMFTWGRGVTLTALIELMGVYWIFGGVFDLSAGILGRTDRSRVWAILGAIVSMVAGFFVMGHPVITGMIAGFWLTYFMGAAAFVIGAAQIFEGRNGKRSLGSLVMGIFTILFGLIVVFNPLFTQSVLFFIMPFWALLAGFGAIATSLRMRSA